MRFRGALLTLCLGALVAVAAGSVSEAQLDELLTTSTTETSTSTTQSSTSTAQTSTSATQTSTSTTGTTSTTETTTTEDGGLESLGSLDLGDVGLSVSTSPGPLTPFAPNGTATSAGALVVTSPVSGWTLQVADTASGSAAPGHLLRSGCTEGAPSLAAPLKVRATPVLLGSSAGTVSLGASAVDVASGPAGTITVDTLYTQAIGAETLASGCTYSVTATFTLSPA